ncbi:hypothetical protein CCUS01_07709, partial [Colletotrichum cuscutae]
SSSIFHVLGILPARLQGNPGRDNADSDSFSSQSPIRSSPGPTLVHLECPLETLLHAISSPQQPLPNLRLGESDAPSPYWLGLIDPGDSSPVNATQETLFLLFAPFCIRIRETSTYPDRPDCLWRMPGQTSLTADSKTGLQHHPSKKPGPCRNLDNSMGPWSAGIPPVPSSGVPEPYEPSS